MAQDAVHETTAYALEAARYSECAFPRRAIPMNPLDASTAATATRRFNPGNGSNGRLETSGSHVRGMFTESETSPSTLAPMSRSRSGAEQALDGFWTSTVPFPELSADNAHQRRFAITPFAAS